MTLTKIPIPVLSALAVTSIALTACSTPPLVHDAGPAPSPSKTLGSEPKIMPAEVAASAIAAAKKFGADKLDTVAATAALTTGRPFLVGLPDGSEPACHSALLVPSDPKVWILNRSGAASSAGSTLSREQLQYGCDSGVERPTPRTAVPAPNLPLDEAAKAAAQRDGKPFIYALPDGSEPACHTAVALPDGTTWYLNRSGGATVEGVALDREGLAYGCGTGVERPAGGVR